MTEKSENARVVKFLSRLNESYSNARNQIIMKKTIPDLSGVYNLIDQDLSQRNIIPIPQSSVFQVSTTSVPPIVNDASASTKTKKITCTHCGFNGHTIDKCYKIHGYPPNFKHKQKTTTTKAVVSQLSLTSTKDAPVNIPNEMKNFSKDQIEGVIAYYNTQLNITHSILNSTPSTSRGTITALPGADDWTS